VDAQVSNGTAASCLRVELPVRDRFRRRRRLERPGVDPREVTQRDVAQPARLVALAKLSHLGVVPQRVIRADGHAGRLRSVEHRLGLRDRASQWLLDEDVAVVFGSRDRGISVERRRQRDDGDVDRFGRQQRPVIVVGPAGPQLLGRPAVRRDRVGRRDDVHPLQGRRSLEMDRPDVSHAEYTNLDVVRHGPGVHSETGIGLCYGRVTTRRIPYRALQGLRRLY
jgi:hypothetical protein